MVGVAVALGLRAAAGGRPRTAWRVGGWTLLLLIVGSGVALTADEPGGNRLLLLCVGLFLAFKVLVTVETRLRGAPSARGLRWLAFAFTWPGMRPGAFSTLRSGRAAGSRRLWAEGLLAMAAGAGLLGLARAVGPAALHGVPGVLLAALGLGFLLHVGLFRALAGFWRARGAAVAPPFHDPQRARSLSEFWGRRWNLAFSEMLQLTVRRPLARRLGAGWAGAATFLLSGVLHELALSVPGRGGYGLPLLYFGMQGALVSLEPRLRWLHDPRRRALQRAWTLGWVALPALLVFHPPALRAVVVPLLGRG